MTVDRLPTGQKSTFEFHRIVVALIVSVWTFFSMVVGGIMWMAVFFHPFPANDNRTAALRLLFAAISVLLSLWPSITVYAAVYKGKAPFD